MCNLKDTGERRIVTNIIMNSEVSNTKLLTSIEENLLVENVKKCKFIKLKIHVYDDSLMSD